MDIHVHSGAARRTSAIISAAIALTAAIVVLLAVSTAAHAATNTFCPDGTTTTWTGTGLWSDQANWSNGLPTDACDAVIESGTVTLTTIDDHYGNESTVAAYGLTIDSGATVIVEGESSQVQGNQSNSTTLEIGADGLAISAGGTLDLQASDLSQTTSAGATAGGSAILDTDGSNSKGITNAGTINASSSDSAWGEELQWNNTLTNTGTIDVQSGKLTVPGANYAMVLDNTGTIDVGTGATYSMSAGDGSSLTNDGTIANQGTLTLGTRGSMYWAQNGGAVSGNPVSLTGSMGLQDAAGTGSFQYTNCAGGWLSGTIPAGQTVSVIGGCSATTVTIGTENAAATLTNDGTLVLDAPSSGGDAILNGGALDNHGTITSTVGGALPLANQLLVPLTNEADGSVTLSGGELEQTTGSTTTNAGTVTIAPGSTWLVQGGAFVNTGTVSLGVASATSLGQFNLTTGSTFTAGGTLAPTLATGYTPTAGTEFPAILDNGGSVSGTFGTVSGGFHADYASQSAASNPNVGVVYGYPPVTLPSLPTMIKVSGGTGKLTVKLSCAKTASSCAPYSWTASAANRTVGTGHGTIEPGQSLTVTLKLNGIGVKLLARQRKLKVKLVIKADGKVLKTATVTVTAAKTKAR